MPTLHYSLDPDGPKRLELAWEGQYRHFTIKLDQQLIGQVADARALAQGHTLPLPDGSTLLLKSVGTAFFNELRVLRNGRPVPGSASDPAHRLRNTYQLIFLIAGVNLVGGFLAGLFRIDSLVQLGFSWGSFLLGVLYLLLGLLVRQLSVVALLLAVVLYGLETVMSAIMPFLTTSSPNFVALAVRALVLLFLFQGFPALQRLNRPPSHTPAPTSGGG